MGKHRDNEGWQDLADRLGVTVRQVHNLKKLEGAPEAADDPAWGPFYEQHRKSPGDQSLKDQKLKEEIALLRIKRAQAEGSSLSVEEMGDFVARFSAKLDQLLKLKLEAELPARMQGKDIVAMRQEARAIHDEIREIYNAGLLEWKPKE